LIAQALGGALGGGQAGSPLGSILSSVASSLGTGSSGGGALGGMLGGVLGGGANRSSSGGIGGGAILAAVMLLVQQQGGIGAVLSKLQSSGLGAHAASWVGTGANMPVSGDQLHQALGADALSGLAAKLGVNTQQAGGVLSQVLPELVNHMTPNGQLPDNHGDLLSEGLQVLKSLGHH
jgi:uncharacterized protein YidB (DUF937 family)